MKAVQTAFFNSYGILMGLAITDLCHAYSLQLLILFQAFSLGPIFNRCSRESLLLKIVELNCVEFNANKMKFCSFTHKGIDGFDQRTNMAGVNITQNNSLDILSLHLQSDLRWGYCKERSPCVSFPH